MARLFFFVAWVVGAPSLALAALGPLDADAAGPAMLVFILSPALAGFALSRGLTIEVPPRSRPQRARGIAAAIVVTSSIMTVCTSAAVAAGVLAPGVRAPGAAAAVVTALATSTLEELGWAAGGLAIVRATLPERVAVPALGVIWACWHLVIAALAPREVVVGMFPLGSPFSVMLPGFVLGCVAFRLLLTELRDRAGTVWAAAAGHAVGNVLLGALLGSGALAFRVDAGWWAFPGPTGLVFLGITMLAWGLLRQRER